MFLLTRYLYKLINGSLHDILDQTRIHGLFDSVTDQGVIMNEYNNIPSTINTSTHLTLFNNKFYA